MTTLLTRYNFLLSYADSTQLERLKEEERLDLLRKIISSGPSENSWRAVIELFASWQDGESKTYALEWANEQLNSWDDKVRTVNSAWIYLYDDSQLSTLAALARFISINHREQYGNKELIIIINSSLIKDVVGLLITKSEIGTSAIHSLASSTYLQNLKLLSLDGVTLGDNQFSILFNAQNLPGLSTLQLKNIGLNSSRLQGLLQSYLIKGIENLDLSYNNLGDEDINALITSSVWKKLSSLNLEGNFLRSKGAVELIKACPGMQIRELNLSRNEIPVNGKEELRTLSREIGVKVIVD